MKSQRGSTMVVVMILLVALLAAGGVAIYLQISDTRSTSLVKQSRDSLYCAEAGLVAARPLIGENYASWSQLLSPDSGDDPDWYPIANDLDDPPDGAPDYQVTVRDNDDELPPAGNDPTVDNDLRIFIVATCTKFPDAPREVLELVMYEGGGALYRDQGRQGSGGTGNAN